MLHKIIATMLTFSLVSSFTFAQEMPGSAAPVASQSAEETLILNSAPLEQKTYISLSDITVTTEFDEAVLSFSTNIPTHAVIEYGLTEEYDHTLSTEPQKIHIETLGELQECSTYYYQVRVSDISSPGEFKTRCPVVKKVVKKSTPVVKKVISQAVETSPEVVTPEIMKNEEGIMNNEEEILLNAAPEVMKNEEGIINNEVAEAEIIEAPQSPILPGPIAFGNDTISDKGDTDNTAPVGLLLFALLSGMVVMLVSFKKQKKWYQK